MGDYGVVIYAGKVIPVVVADAGPSYKFGEGSMALHRALGVEFCTKRNAEGQCIATKAGSSIGADVITIIFPGSRDPQPSLSPDNLATTVDAKAMALYQAFVKANSK